MIIHKFPLKNKKDNKAFERVFLSNASNLKIKWEENMYLIKNGNVHIGDGSEAAILDILIEGNKIVNIGESLKSDEAIIIDAKGYEVFPGFIDPACAIGAVSKPDKFSDNDEISNPITPQLNIKYSMDPDELNAQEFYKSGITSVGLSPTHNNIMGGRIAVFKTAPDRFVNRLVKEKAALKCSVTSDVKRTYGKRNQLPMTKMGIFYLFRDSIRIARAKNYDDLEIKDKVILDIFNNNSMQLFVAASTKAEIDGILNLLMSETVKINLVDAFAFGDSLPEILERGTGIILGNLSMMSQIGKHGIDLKKINDLLANDNLVALTTSNGGYSEGREVFIWNAIEIFKAGINIEQIVKMMCLNPAIMLGVDDRIGSIEIGKDADISIYTNNPIKSYMARVKYSIINGEVVYRDEFTY